MRDVEALRTFVFTPAIELPRLVEAFVIFVFAVLIFVLAVASDEPKEVEARSV